MTNSDITSIQGIVAPIFGKVAWNVKLGHGKFITLNFGQTLPADEEGRVFGEWYLWVRYCEWRIESETEVIVASHDKILDSELKILEALSVERVHIQKPSLETIIVFSGSIRLILFPEYSSTENELDHWMLFAPGQKVLIIGPESTWLYDNTFAKSSFS